MAEPLYQLEKAEEGGVFVCLDGHRLAVLPKDVAGTYCKAIERIEGERGKQIALRWLTLGIAAGSPPLSGMCAPIALDLALRADSGDGRGRS